MRPRLLVCCVLAFLLIHPRTSVGQEAARVTILYDAFGKRPELKQDWGFSVLVEYGGKRILFDAGNDPDVLEQNVRALSVDLSKLDFVVFSHRHGDHTTGLTYLLRINPNVKIYAPRDLVGIFGGTVPKDFYRHLDSLPADWRYFAGTSPDSISTGTPWPQARFVQVERVTEIALGIHLIPTISQVPGTRDLPELSLSVQTPQGAVLVVGCSHAGIEQILEASREVAPHVRAIFGGLHLVRTPAVEIERIVTAVHDRYKVDQIAPGHCTGEAAFATFRRIFGDHLLYAGVGTVIGIP